MTTNERKELIVIGGGLAGSEAAWQAAQRGIRVRLYEMRPQVETGAHVSGDLAELVCSNSLGSNLPDRASGVLKAELRRLGSLLLEIAEATALPAGSALAVDREAFSKAVTARLSAHPNIEIVRAEVTEPARRTGHRGFRAAHLPAPFGSDCPLQRRRTPVLLRRHCAHHRGVLD